MNKSAVLTFLFFSVISGQTVLSGNIGGMTFSPEGNPYIINESVKVRKGKTVILNAGCIFLFREFTGITVDGGFIVKGTDEQPVIFTTINSDTAYAKAGQLPNPFDWNGIQINNNAGNVTMLSFILSFSVFGLKSLKNDIRISKGIFRRNGQAHFLLRNSIMPVAENIPYSYSIDLMAASTPFSVSMRKSAIPVLLSTTGMLSGAGAIYFYTKKERIHEEYEKTTDQTDYNRIGSNESKALTRLVICSSFSALCFTSAAVLFTIGTLNEKRDERTSLRLDFRPESIKLSFSVFWRSP